MNNVALIGLTDKEIYDLSKFHNINENVLISIYETIYINLCELNPVIRHDVRELIASWVEEMCQGLDADTIAEAIRNGGNDAMDNFRVSK